MLGIKAGDVYVGIGGVAPGICVSDPGIPVVEQSVNDDVMFRCAEISPEGRSPERHACAAPHRIQ